MTCERLQEIREAVEAIYPAGTADAELEPAELLRELIAAVEGENDGGAL